MKRIARGLALTVVAFMALVPLQATPALADGAVDIAEPEETVRVTGSSHHMTVTLAQVTGAPASVANQTINFEWDPTNGPGMEEASCSTDGAGTCMAEVTSDEEAELTIRAYHVDGSTTPCTGIEQNPLPTSDCDENEAVNEDGDNDDTDAISVEFVNGTLDVEPEDATSAPSSEVKLTATVMSDEATPRPLVANVDAEITTGPNDSPGPAPGVDSECDTAPATGVCELKYTPGATVGVDELDAWVDRNEDPGPPPAGDTPTGDETEGADFEGDGDEGPDEGLEPGTTQEGDRGDETDVVKVSISGGQVLTLNPSSATLAPGSSASILARVTTAGAVQSGVKVAGAVLTGGAHPGQTVACTTGPDGQCTLGFTGSSVGVDKLRATVDTDGNGQPNEADSTEDIGVAGGTAEPDTTALAQITWVRPAPPPGGGGGGAGDKAQCDVTRATAGKGEILIGTKGKDRLCGFGGNDSLRGLAGNDKLNGGKGKDTAKGGKGKDRCKAEKETKSCEK